MRLAAQIPFDELYAKLQEAKNNGLVYERFSDDGLSLYTYTQECTYNKAWDEITMLARGLILDVSNKKVVAQSFPKFFNYGEQDIPLPDQPFEVFDKMDGSLIIVYHHGGRWKCATKGSFNSDQAQWAQKQLNKHPMPVSTTGDTYLFEAIYKENKIVVNYDFEDLILLGAYHKSGSEYDYRDLQCFARKFSFKLVKRQAFTSFTDIIEHVKTLSSNEEGFVIRYANGYRIKLKGEEYLRIHRMISQVTPLAIWNLMLHDCKLEDYRKELPEEFWDDFDSISSIIQNSFNMKVNELTSYLLRTISYTDKELGLVIRNFPKTVQSCLFPYRNDKENFLRIKLGKTGEIIPCPRLTIFNSIKPKANVLDGYVPSRYLENINDE